MADRSGSKGRSDQAAGRESSSNLFAEVNALRHGKPAVDQDALDREKVNNTIFGKLAIWKPFEYTTLSIIVLNAGYIGYDADFSARWEKPPNLYDCDGFRGDQCYQFIIFENLFAVYFTFEVIVRFLAYKEKKTCIWDGWFVFDSTLVLFMVVETWILPVVGASGPLAQLSVLRLLRLLRITRMAKLMRFFPELQIILKGMVAAVRSVACTAILLMMILYVWSILFTSEFHQGDMSDDDVAGGAAEFFGTMDKSMRSLFIMGTVLDDITLCCNYIRGSNKGVSMMIAFIIFVLISSFTMLNMLIGILCEVVCATGEGERHKNMENSIRESITNLFTKMDKDHNGQISREEFLSMRRDRNVMKALESLDVKTKHFEMYADLMFKEEEETAEGEAPGMDFEETLSMIMRLRPGISVSALDFASFQMNVAKNHEKMKKSITTVEKMTTALTGKETGGGAAPASGGASPVSRGNSSLEVKKTSVTPSLDDKTDEQILVELQRRIGAASIHNVFGADGKENASPPAPMNVFSSDEPGLIKAGDVYTHAWSKETYTC